MSATPHRIQNSIIDMYHTIGTLQGYACGLESTSQVNLEVLCDGLRECADVLERVASTIREEYDK